MAKYQIRQLENDQILYKYDAHAKQEFGGPWGDSNQCANEEMPQAEADQEARDEKMSQLRGQRDAKLVDVDKARYAMVWADQSGTPMSQEDKDAWADYRQELLDIPANVGDIDALDLESMEWPVKP